MRVVLAVALHVPYLLVELQIVRLEAPDLGAQLRDHLELFAEFLCGRYSAERQTSGNVDAHTSSSSAFRCRKRSRWLVTMGRIDVSAEDVNGIGFVCTDGSFYPKRKKSD